MRVRARARVCVRVRVREFSIAENTPVALGDQGVLFSLTVVNNGLTASVAFPCLHS
jgi:hypothetical protein